MSVVDASVWVSRFWPDDAFHTTSRNWIVAATQSGQPLIAPTIMLAEVSGAIARRTGDRQLGYQIVQRIRRLPTLQLVAVNDSLGQFGAQLASEYQLRGANALYVATASRLQLPLISWDREQIDRAGELISTGTPEPGD